MSDVPAIKSVSIETVEEATSDALAKLTGCQYVVSIRALDILQDALLSPHSMAIKMSLRTPRVPDPFQDIFADDEQVELG